MVTYWPAIAMTLVIMATIMAWIRRMLCGVEMAHESTIEPEDIKLQEDEERLVQSRTRSRSMDTAPASQHTAQRITKSIKALSLVAETPTSITHHHDDDDEDDVHAAAADNVTA